MKIACWNVNSLKVRLPHVLQWLEVNPVDVLCLQETKLTDDKFPESEIRAAGYYVEFNGQKTYNGVAILSRHPISDVVKNNPHFADEQQRLLTATIQGVRIICAYIPNGQAPETDKFQYKLKWLAGLQIWLEEQSTKFTELALLGDFNIAPEDRDVHDPAAWLGQNLVSPPERAAFQAMLSVPLVDAYRMFDQAEKSFSWWDYRALGFRLNKGMRIDHILLSTDLAKRCQSCVIDRLPRKWEQPSDHAPVIATIN
ncbi:exodeoxyribonuclease-3 [Oxalobacteraceae bacterium GrIS 2.11]